MNSESGEFPAGPSFLEYDRPDIRMVELPAWLQTFAATVGDPGDEWPEPHTAHQLDGGDFSMTASEGDENELAPWLQGTEGEPQNGVPAGNGSSVDPAFMISEEDLPDWLRSIAPDETGNVSGSDDVVGGGGIRIPAVSRAWVPDVDQSASADESASVFSLVASQGPQAAYSGVAENQVEGDQVHALEQTRPVLAHAPVKGTSAAQDGAAKEGGLDEDAGSRGASRLLPLMAGVALLLLIILIVVFLL